MKMSRTISIVSAIIMTAVFSVQAQEPADTTTVRTEEKTEEATPQTSPRKVTPVDIDDHKQTPVLHYFDKHGDPLEEPVLFLATLDTVTKVKSKPVYPAYNGITVGVNFADAIMMAFNQKYASYDVSADVSIFNWLFPSVEAGIGFADSKPDNHNFSYKVKPSFYAKLGFNYNFLYKSKPDYQVLVGFRAGFSNFAWDVNNITINSSYWDESQTFDMTGMRSTAWWGEALAGIKVKIVSHFSLGWTIRWHFPFKFSTSRPEGLPAGIGNAVPSKPWFVPGYGGNGPITFSFSAMWTIPGRKKAEKPVVENQ